MDLFWLPHDTLVYAPGRRASVDVTGRQFRYDDDSEVSLPADKLPKLRRVQQAHLFGVDNICDLEEVHEAALLHTVRIRYGRMQIYTRVARILIAVNAFKPLSIYSAQQLDRYAKAADSMDLAPHVYGIGLDAVNGLRKNGRSQAVLISGESGAGKTESTKLTLSFIAEALGSAGAGVEDKIISTSPILEAFGNAMTVRNNNSSRFGKWLEVHVDSALDIRGCSVTDYLLELTRVCGCGERERSYHIFFQLLQAKGSTALEGLPMHDAAQYHYLQGSQLRAPGVDDARCFEELRDALRAMAFTELAQRDIFSIVLGVLALGNIDIDEAGDEASIVNKDAVGEAASLLGIAEEELSRAMVVRNISVGREVTSTRRSPAQAKATRDAFARLIYGRLFKWLIMKINLSLDEAIQDASKFVGVLDIAGFERFDRNSLEQLFINLSNEHLQLHFNAQVFQMELADYEAEGVECGTVEFKDNSDIVALFCAKGGILSMLDEEIAVPKATDQTFITKLVRAHSENPRFVAPKFHGSVNFGVQHFAGVVTYCCRGFLEKNADSPPQEAAALLTSSSLAVLKEIAVADDARETSHKRASTKQGKSAKTWSSSFKASLAALMEKLGTAEPHFIRCVKPNSDKVPDRFVSRLAMEQLECSGVLEAVKIRQQGFSSRIPFAEFVSRYRIVVSRATQAEIEGIGGPDEDAERAKKLLSALPFVLDAVGGVEPGDAMPGKTKVFLKTRAAAVLEKSRNMAMVGYAVDIQRVWRGQRVRAMMQSCKLVFAELESWCNRNKFYGSPDAKSTAIAKLATPKAIEDEIANGQLIMERALELPLEVPNASNILNVFSRMEAEARLVRELKALTSSVDPIQMDKAVARAEEMRLPEELYKKLRKRLKSLKAQVPLVRAMEAALEKQDLEELNSVYDAVKQAGLYGSDAWLGELKGEELTGRVFNAIDDMKKKHRLTQIVQIQKEENQAKVFTVEEKQARLTTFAPRESVLGEKRKVTITGLDANGQEEILMRLARAAAEYDAEDLEETLAEATGQGMGVSDLGEYENLLAKLQTQAFVLEALAEAAAKTQLQKQATSSIRALQNLIQQAQELEVPGEEVEEARKQMQKGLRHRARTTIHGTLFDMVDPEELQLMQNGFGDLADFPRLRPTEEWRGHRAARTFGFRVKGAKAMLSFSKSEITQSLTKLTRKEEKLALQVFRDILVWMYVRPVSECMRVGYSQNVVDAASSSRAMGDEVYVQVMKQLTDNPSERSIAQGWRLMLLLCHQVFPSEELEEFVRSFLTKAVIRKGADAPEDIHLIAKQCVSDLNKLGSTNRAAVEDGTLVPVQVLLLDGCTRKLYMRHGATLSELGDQMAEQLRISNSKDFRFFQLTDGFDVHRMLPEATALSTLSEKWYRLKESTGRVSRLLYKRAFLRSDEILEAGDLNHALLTYRQAVWDYLHYPIREPVDFLCQVAAMLLCFDPTHFTDYIEGNKLHEAGVLEELLPEVVLCDIKRTQWAKQILEEYKKCQTSLDPTETRLMKMSRIFTMLKQMKLFGAHCWLGKQVLNVPADKISLPRVPTNTCKINSKEPEAKYWICVDRFGVRFLSVDAAPGCAFERVFVFNSEAVERVLHWGAKQDYLQIVVSAVNQQSPTLARTPMLIAMTSPAALDVAYTIYTVVEAYRKRTSR